MTSPWRIHFKYRTLFLSALFDKSHLVLLWTIIPAADITYMRYPLFLYAGYNRTLKLPFRFYTIWAILTDSDATLVYTILKVKYAAEIHFHNL